MNPSSIDDSSDFPQQYLANHHELLPSISTSGMFSAEQIRNRAEQINLRLDGICFERLGDVISSSPVQASKTLQVVETLISTIKRHKDAVAERTIDVRELKKSEQQNIRLKEKLEKDKKNLQNQKERLIKQRMFIQTEYKKKVSGLEKERQQLNIKLKQFMTREKAIDVDKKQRDVNIKKLQDRLKLNQDKSIKYVNNFEMFQKLEGGAAIYSTNGEHEYSKMSAATTLQKFAVLRNENQYLKKCLLNVYRELNSVLELKKETLRNKRGFDGDYDSNFDLNVFREETLRLPQYWSEERLVQLNGNIQKFKQAIKMGDYAQGKVEQRKNNCVQGVSQLINNYKQMINAQSHIIDKVLVKSKEYRAVEMAHHENKLARSIDENRFEQANRFLREHEQYLEQKNIDLERTRKIAQQAIRKAEQQKQLMLKQRSALEEQALKIRQTIEVMPAMVEEELSRRGQ